MSAHETATLPDADVLARLAVPEYRVDGPDKVTGRTRYAGDRTQVGTLWAAFLQSNVPHGRIRSIDTSRAKAMPGVRAVLTGADTNGARFGRVLFDRPVLCSDVVRFVGDRMAAVAADTLEQAEAAVDAIDVDIEELPAIFDPADALVDGAPILHPDPGAYAYGAGTRPALPHPNIQGRQARRRGAEDIEAVFAAAPHVFEHEFSTARTHHGAMEPHATLVWIDGEIVRVISTNKAPAKVRDQMARALGLPPTQIDVDSAAIGGDFGGKGYSVDEFVCYFLAKATGRPVKAVARYADELAIYNVRHASRMRLRSAVDKDGRILAHQGRMIFDGGAYASAKPMPHVTPAQGMATLAGYRVPNVDIEAIAVYTNSVPGGHVRSPGEVQSVFAGESHLDAIATALRIDPIELRLRNVVRTDEDEGALGDRFHAPRAAEAFERLRTEMRWGSPRSPGRGRGVALCVLHVGTAAGAMNLGLQVTADGRLQVITGLPDQGGGQLTLIRRVLAAAASIDESRISFVKRTTIDTPGDPGVGGSWVTHMASRAAQQLGERLRDWVDERVPRALPDAPADVVLRDDWLVDGATGERLIDFGEVASRLIGSDEPVELAASYNPGMHAPGEAGDADFAAFGVEVSVDRETGAITIHDAVLVVDAGVVINPVAHAGQLEGGFAFGVGTALMEELVVDGGSLVGRTLGEVRLPTTRDVPPLRIVLLPPAPGPGAFGAKSAGELSNAQIAPAIANAVADAIGVRVTELPLTPERVVAAVRAKAGASG